jgi:hypothetical protein
MSVPTEELLPLSVLARDIPNVKGGKGVNVITLWRWAQRPNRHGVKLKTWLVGAIRMSTRAAIAEYIAACTAAADGTAPPKPAKRDRQSRISAAEAELARASA